MVLFEFNEYIEFFFLNNIYYKKLSQLILVIHNIDKLKNTNQQIYKMSYYVF